MTAAELAFAGAAGAGAGFVNALSGGGTLLSFPALTAIGMPAVAANVTNSVALCPGYFGAVMAQRHDLRGQRQRLSWLVPAAALGGFIGGVLLLLTGEGAFRSLIPFLILLACVLLIAQDPVRKWLARRPGGPPSDSVPFASLLIALAGVYGGYFGGGLSAVVLAVLGILLEDSLTRLNALKQLIGLVVNFAAVVLFVFSTHVVWSTAIVMMIGALAGGALGGRVATNIKPATLRIAVVGLGVAVAIVYFAKPS